MSKIAYQYEYQIDMKYIEFTPHKRSAMWGLPAQATKLRSVGSDASVNPIAAREISALKHNLSRREIHTLAIWKNDALSEHTETN